MGKRNRPIISSASALVAGVKKQPDSSCAFCGKKDHETVNCSQARKKTVDERWKQANDKKLCFNCLRPTNNCHNSGNCRQPSCTAEGCGKKHHRLLHQETQTVTDKEQHQPQTEFSGFVKLRYVKAWVQNLMKTRMQHNVSMHFNLLFLGNFNEI